MAAKAQKDRKERNAFALLDCGRVVSCVWLSVCVSERERKKKSFPFCSWIVFPPLESGISAVPELILPTMASSSSSPSVKEYLFTSECVSPGHPDKLCDQVSDAVLDACLTIDPLAKVCNDTLVKRFSAPLLLFSFFTCCLIFDVESLNFVSRYLLIIYKILFIPSLIWFIIVMYRWPVSVHLLLVLSSPLERSLAMVLSTFRR